MQTTGHVQLKPTSTMFSCLEARATHYQLTINTMVRQLLALNLNNLDWRFYPIVRSMALANKNTDTFEQCADHIGSYLEGAFLRKSSLRPSTIRIGVNLIIINMRFCNYELFNN